MADLTPAFPELFAAITAWRAGDRDLAAKLIAHVVDGPHAREAFNALLGLYLGSLEVLEIVGSGSGWNSEQFVQRAALAVEMARITEGGDR